MINQIELKLARRKKPVRHIVKGYTRRDGTRVSSHIRGRGSNKTKRKSISRVTKYYDPYEADEVTISISEVWDYIEGTAWDEMHAGGFITDYYDDYSALRDWVDGQYDDYGATTGTVPSSHRKYLDNKTRKLHRELIKEYGKR